MGNRYNDVRRQHMTDNWTLGDVHEIALSQGSIRYREAGSGPPVVFIHGLLANGLLWRNVVPALAAHHRCIVPDLPLGGHTLPMPHDADLTFPGVARLVEEFLAALDLHDVTLVGVDTGGVVCQFVVADHGERVARLVLANCDALDNFLPLPGRYLQWGAHVPGFVWLLSKALRVRALDRLPITFGWLTKRPIAHAVMDAYFAPMITDTRIRHDLGKVLRDISPRRTLDVATRLPHFTKPVVLMWANEDRLFPLRYGAWLSALFPNARLVTLDDAYGLIPEDRPDAFAEQIAAFVNAPVGAVA